MYKKIAHVWLRAKYVVMNIFNSNNLPTVKLNPYLIQLVTIYVSVKQEVSLGGTKKKKKKLSDMKR